MGRLPLVGGDRHDVGGALLSDDRLLAHGVGVVRSVGAVEDALVLDDPLEHRRGGGADEDGRSSVKPGELVEVDGRESVAARLEDLGGL